MTNPNTETPQQRAHTILKRHLNSDLAWQVAMELAAQSEPLPEALDAAIKEGVKQFEQQMQLGGGNLSDMFEAVIRTYLSHTQPTADTQGVDGLSRAFAVGDIIHVLDEEDCEHYERVEKIDDKLVTTNNGAWYVATFGTAWKLLDNVTRTAHTAALADIHRLREALVRIDSESMDIYAIANDIAKEALEATGKYD